MNRAIDALFAGVAELNQDVRSWKTASAVRADTVRDHLASRYGAFDSAIPRQEVADDVLRMLREWAVHVIHPRYFGLFNPAVHEASVVADALVAAFNPQLAAWSHSPVANEVERYLIPFLPRASVSTPRRAWVISPPEAPKPTIRRC